MWITIKHKHYHYVYCDGLLKHYFTCPTIQFQNIHCYRFDFVLFVLLP